jgi:hypothetical protein
MPASHNLNIHMYSLEEILGLFDLTYDLDSEGVKRAKRKVLMLHPDKSRLPADYFLFYKKAFEIVVQYYEEQTRHTRKTSVDPVYSHLNEAEKSVKKTINGIKNEDFQRKFNELFEKNVSVKPDPHRNEWFKNDEPMYGKMDNVSAQTMGRAFDTIKSSNAIISRNAGVQTLRGGGGTNLYEDADDDGYVTCDPFSKLKFEDLRKVHKDQTVLAVSERDYESVQKYNSMDHLIQERGRAGLTPLEKSEAERILETRQKEHERLIMRKQHEATLKAMENEKMGQALLSNFLRLGN